MSAAEVIFWISLSGLAYLYAGYPLLVAWMARRHPQPIAKGSWEGRVSVVLAACNEATRLQQKLKSLFASTAADRIVEVLIGSDGSTDATAAVARGFPDFRVQVFEWMERRGKPAVLNDLVLLCRGDVILFLDARQDLCPTAIEQMLENFADQAVGVVSGELVFTTGDCSTTASEGVGFYWTYEKWIRTNESRFRSAPGATGALYALRRKLFRPIPANTLLDDVVIPMQAIEQGYRCVLERGAEIYDRPSCSTEHEAIRKRRTIAGCAQLLVSQPRWLLPWRNPIWWEFCSHKLARLASPWLLAAVAVANLNLLGSPLYAVLAAVQASFYVSACVGWAFQRVGLRSVMFGPSLMFVSLNATTLAAIWDAARGRYSAAWRRTA